MEMHMVHVNSKYLNDDGTVDPVAYQTSDGLAVLGFMFKVKSSEVTIIYNNMFYILRNQKIRTYLFIFVLLIIFDLL